MKPYDHLWQVLRADSMELADNPLLEKRLMQELNQPVRQTSLWRKMAIAAGILTGCLVLGGGIATAAGYNPFRAFQVLFVDEHGQEHQLHADENNVLYDDDGNEVGYFEAEQPAGNGTTTVKGTFTKPGTYKVEMSSDGKAKK